MFCQQSIARQSMLQKSRAVSENGLLTISRLDSLYGIGNERSTLPIHHNIRSSWPILNPLQHGCPLEVPQDAIWRNVRVVPCKTRHLLRSIDVPLLRGSPQRCPVCVAAGFPLSLAHTLRFQVALLSALSDFCIRPCAEVAIDRHLNSQGANSNLIQLYSAVHHMPAATGLSPSALHK